MTKHYITPEEHARLQRRRGRQALGLLITILVLVGFVTVLRAGVGLVANLFDDTAQKQEYEDKLEGLVLFDPMPFDGIENIDDLTLREAAVWGCIYNIQETQGGFDNYNTDPDTEQLLLPSVEVDAYLARLVGPSFKLTHRSFEMEDMTIEFDESSQCYKIPVTGTVGYYRAVVTKLFKRSGQLHVTVGYIPTSSTDDSIINQSSEAGWLPRLANQQYLLPILVIAIMTGLMYVYLQYSKHGYEIAVVGESQRTASYAGIKVDRVIIRTMVLSGAMCGLIGFLLTTGVDHTLTTTIVDGRGFTAVMVSWMSKFNPFIMIAASLLLVVMDRGASEVSSVFGLNHSFADILTGIILFFIIGTEFFITYKVSLRKNSKKEA